MVDTSFSFSSHATEPAQVSRPSIARSDVNSHVPQSEERKLGTDGVLARYHHLLNLPYSDPLTVPGYIVGIEKTRRGRIGHGEGHDADRLRPPTRLPNSGVQRDLENRQSGFKRIFGEPKAMFVSHILRYSGDAYGMTPDLAYSAYSETALGPAEPDAPIRAYEAGWAALDQMEAQILSDLETAKAAGHPFSHLVFLSMGWNNDQLEALERYNAIMQHTRNAARKNGQTFRPFVIGLTWPSVWGGTSASDLANRLLHLGSYTVKADDADEIGYSIANHIANAMLPRIEYQSGLRSVMIGHSMGARILSRAYYSSDVLRGAVVRQGPAPLLIGLQAAFSANRFKSGFRLIPPVRWVIAGEGGPYQDPMHPGGQVVLTWSKTDFANPLARLGTGAAHVGAFIGAWVVRRSLSDKLLSKDWSDPQAAQSALREAMAAGKVLYLNATPIIATHGDIRNPDVGRLVWAMIAASAPDDEVSQHP